MQISASVSNIVQTQIKKHIKTMQMHTNLIEKYSNCSILRAGVNLIPTIGGALDILLSEQGAKYREKRLQNFLSSLDSRIGELELQNEELKERLSNEAFYDLFIHAAESCIKTRHDSKHIAYANILLHQFSQNYHNSNTAELMMITLDNLSIEEIEYLSELNESNGELIAHIIYGTKINKKECIDILIREKIELENANDIPSECKFKQDLDIIWKFLSDKNIIEIIKNDKPKNEPYSYGNNSQSTTAHLQFDGEIKYRTSSFGKEFINWIIQEK